MALTPSAMLPLGTCAPDFTLPDTDGSMVTLSKAKGRRGSVVMFISNHCPFVKHLKPDLTRLANDYSGHELAFFAINANDTVGYPADHPDRMAEDKAEFGYPFPYLFDESQVVAKSFQAACTPDFFVFDGNLQLVYRGQFDDSRPGNDLPVTGADIRNALDLLLLSKPVPEPHRPSIGCNIKWKP